MNIQRPNLVESNNVLLPLHIKLGLMKQFVKALPKDGQCFQYLCAKFPHLSAAKKKEGIFDFDREGCLGIIQECYNQVLGQHEGLRLH